MPIDSSVHQKRFLECFAACGQVLQAARWAKLHRNAHYQWLDRDETYAARFRDAERRFARKLQDEAIRRAHDGVRKVIRYKGKVVGYEQEYSDTLMVQLLKAKIPEEFTEQRNDKLQVTGQDGGPLIVEFVKAKES